MISIKKDIKVGSHPAFFYNKNISRSPINQGGSAPTVDSNGNNTTGTSGIQMPGSNLEDVNASAIKNITKNPKVSYSGTQAQSVSVKEAIKIREIMHEDIILKKGIIPPGYYNNVEYKHRESINNTISEDEKVDSLFRLGDCMFSIPPEFISVNNETTSERVQGVRESSSVYIKNAYVRKEIQVNIVLNGLNQINGYEVESPFANRKYYVDGLRTLLAQYRFAPFVPVENAYLNLVHDIYFVALKNISVETIQGFPETLNLTLHLQNFNTESLVPAPCCVLTDMIDWDLFRWYTQRPLANDEYGNLKLKKIEKGALTANIKLSSITLEAIESELKDDSGDRQDLDSIDLLKDSNFATIIDTENDKENGYQLVGISISTGNYTPIIQLAAQESPMMQYLGCTDTSFVLDFEINGEEKAMLFTELLRHSLGIVRENRFLNGVGFVKVENELINLTGTEHVIINNIQHSTVPGFPGVYSVQLSCTSCDTTKTRKKAVEGFRAVKEDNLGTMDDVYTTDLHGLSTKLRQDMTAEEKLQRTELYGDLELPTYKKVDEVVATIRAWRTANGLKENIMFEKYPRRRYYSSSSLERVEYDGFVDPDFYYFYDINISLEDDGIEGESSTEDESRITPYSVELEASKLKFYKKYRGIKDISEIPNIDEIQKDLTKLIKSGAISKPTELFKIVEPKPDVAIEPEFVWGWEPWLSGKIYKGLLSQMASLGSMTEGTSNPNEGATGGDGPILPGSGGTGNSTLDPMTVSKRTGNPFVDFLMDRADSQCGYLWAAHGEFCTEQVWNARKRKYGSAVKDVSRKWIGRQVFDCSGFVSWGLCKVGFKPKGWRTTTHGYIGMRNISKSQLRCGDILVTTKHAAVYIGNGKTVESMNSKKGVCYGELGDRFTHFVRPDGLEEAINKFLKNNPRVYATNGPSRPNDNTSSSQNIRSVDNAYTDTPIERRPDVGNGSSSNEETNANNQAAANARVVLANFGNGNPCDKWNSFILASAKKYNLDPNFIKCIISIESNGNPNAKNGVPCAGLMQINLNCHKVPGGNPYDPAANIDYGCKVWDNYRKISYVGTDIQRWMCSYNAGPGYAQSVFVHKTKTLPRETVNYITKYQNLYSKLRANGAKSGLTNTPGGRNYAHNSNGEYTEAGGGSGVEDGLGNSISNIWEYTAADFKNPNAGKKHGEKISKVNIDEISVTYCKDNTEGKKEDDKGQQGKAHTISPTEIDRPTKVNDSMEGSKVKARFAMPFVEKVAIKGVNSFIYIVGDTQDWQMNGSNSLSGATNSTPGISNPTSDQIPEGYQPRAPINQGSSGSSNQQGAGPNGIIVLPPDPNDNRKPIQLRPVKHTKDTAAVNSSETAVEYMFVDEAKYSRKSTMLRAFPTYLITIIDEQSDWHDTKKLWSNYYICNNLISIDILKDYSSPCSTCNLQLSNFYNNLSASKKPVLLKDVAFDDDDYIRRTIYEWTGAIVDEEITDKMLAVKNQLHTEIRIQVGARIHIRLGYGSNPDDLPTVFNGNITDLEDGEVMSMVAQDDGRELVSSLMTDKPTAVNTDIDIGEEVSNIMTELLCRRESDFIYAFTWGGFKFNNAYGISHFGNHYYTMSGSNHQQYDLIKNIYNGTYEGIPYYKYPLNPFDGESNYRFMVNDKTPWDVMKMCEKAMPEFIASYRSFGFDNRIFFGLPNWICKYKSIETEDGLYELGKSFSQIHNLHSDDSIIDNTIRVSTRYHFTNAVGVYCLGGDLATTPIIFSDFRIDAGKQKTKTIDTSSTQDFGFVPGLIDKAIEWIGAHDNGKNMAIKICISEILDSWKNIYRGNIIIVGQPQINPYDFLYLEDTFIKINGACTVRNVMHSLSMETGLITTIAPGLIGFNTLKTSGLTNMLRGALTTCSSYMLSKRFVGATIAGFNKYKTKVMASRFVTAAKGGFNFLKSGGSTIWSSFKTGKIVTNAKHFINAVDTLYDATVAIKAAKKLKTIVTTARTAVVAFVGANAWNPAGWIALALGIIIDILINLVLQWFIDEFKYRNCITLYPLFRTLPDGKTIYLVGSHHGSRDLLPQNNKEGYEDTQDIESELE